MPGGDFHARFRGGFSRHATTVLFLFDHAGRVSRRRPRFVAASAFIQRADHLRPSATVDVLPSGVFTVAAARRDGFDAAPDNPARESAAIKTAGINGRN